jgi:citronellol/citronellal dehydrogenase
MDRYRSAFAPGLFSGQVVLVTGGGTGIGRCVAHELAALGATVVLAARRAEPLAATAAEIADAGGTADTLALNVRDADAVEEGVGAVVARHGRLDGLVNNAGGQFTAQAEDISPNGWRSVVDLNLNGTFLVTRAAFRAWMGERGGAVVSVVADMWNGFPHMAHTGAARAGVVNLTQTLAVEWAGRGVRVNAVAPGLVYSSGWATYPEEVRAAAGAGVGAIPAGRAGTESETAAAITFLLSPAAAFVTGATLRVDGGGSLVPSALAPLPRRAPAPIPPFDAFHLADPLPAPWNGEA